MNQPKLEVCVDSAKGMHAAIKGNADRIELCSDLALGGLTPSRALMALATGSPVPVRVMIRPRSGNFCYAGDEIAQMKADIDLARRAGLSGVVLGASTPDRQLEPTLLRQLLRHAAPLPATLHRVVDTLQDPRLAVTTAIDLGFDTILTSGGKNSAYQGLPVIGDMMRLAAGRIDIMPGAGIRVCNAAEILKATGTNWLHASCSRDPEKLNYLSAPNSGTNSSTGTDAGICQKISDICRNFNPPT